MNKKIIIIAAVLLIVFGLLVLIGRTEKPMIDDEVFTIEESREIAENWIKNNSLTYVFDGHNLSLESEQELLKQKIYSFIFSFESRSAGYGDRTDQMTAQVITPHTIEIIVDEGEVVIAVTDEIYDEIKDELIEKDDEELIEIDLYFVQIISEQEEVVAVQRLIPYTVATGRAAIEELLKGPLPNEEAEGFSTAINQRTELQNIEIDNGVAFVDFNQRLGENIAGSAWVTMIRDQIEKTLLQFGTINEVVISINGVSEDILQP